MPIQFDYVQVIRRTATQAACVMASMFKVIVAAA